MNITITSAGRLYSVRGYFKTSRSGSRIFKITEASAVDPIRYYYFDDVPPAGDVPPKYLVFKYLPENLIKI